MEIRGERVILRRVDPDDAPRLSAILATPEVARWWPAFDLVRVQAEFLVEQPDYVPYAIVVDGRLVGLIQTNEEQDPEFRHATIDLFLEPAVHGQGLGPDAIRAVVRHLVEVNGHHRVTIDPVAANERAIRAYGKVGFRPVGTSASTSDSPTERGRTHCSWICSRTTSGSTANGADRPT